MALASFKQREYALNMVRRMGKRKTRKRNKTLSKLYARGWRPVLGVHHQNWQMEIKQEGLFSPFER